MSILPGSSDHEYEKGSHGPFRYEIVDPKSTTASVKVYIPDGGSFEAVPGCMFLMSDNVKIRGQIKKSIKSLLGPEKSTFQTFVADGGEGWVIITPGLMGGIKAMHLEGDEICVGDDAYIASIGDIDSNSQSKGIKETLLSGGELFVKKIRGTGVVFVCGVGSLMTFKLGEGETVVADNGHMVTWPASIKYDIQKASKSWFESGVSGEGAIVKMTGPAEITMQTRSPEAMADDMSSSKGS